MSERLRTALVSAGNPRGTPPGGPSYTRESTFSKRDPFLEMGDAVRRWCPSEQSREGTHRADVARDAFVAATHEATAETHAPRVERKWVEVVTCTHTHLGGVRPITEAVGFVDFDRLVKALNLAC